MINAILKYQETDAKKRNIEITLGKSESRKKMAEAKKYLETVEEKITKLEQRAGELAAVFESAVASQKKLAAEAQEFSHAIDDVEDEAGANFLVKKLDELYGKIKAVDEEAARAENEIKAVIAEYAKIKTLTAKAKQQFAENKEEYAKLKESFKGELESIEKELSVLEKDVDEDLMALYKKKRAEKIFPIVYAVKDGYCGACNMEMPMNTVAEIKNGKIVECDQCKRLLYAPAK